MKNEPAKRFSDHFRERVAEPKFPECVSCRWARSSCCSRCGAGEFFEERIRELSPDHDFRFGDSRDED